MGVRPFAISYFYISSHEDGAPLDLVLKVATEGLSEVTGCKINMVFTGVKGCPRLFKAMFSELNYSREFEIKYSKRIEQSLLDLFNDSRHCIGFVLNDFEFLGGWFRRYGSLIYSSEYFGRAIANIIYGGTVEFFDGPELLDCFENKNDAKYFHEKEWECLKNGWALVNPVKPSV